MNIILSSVLVTLCKMCRDVELAGDRLAKMLTLPAKPTI